MASQRAPRHGRKVTVTDLEHLQTSQTSHYLYCRRCHGSYSADVADYFMMRADTPFKCCKVNNWLCVKR